MITDSGSTESYWMRLEDFPNNGHLKEPATVDVCIVGAGIAGLTTAYLLLLEGKTVMVLDDGPVAGGETSRTTAHLVSAIDDGYTEIERIHGENASRLAAEAHSMAIERIESIVKSESIDCDFTRVDGYLMLGPEQKTKILDDELAAAHRAGLTDVEMVPGMPLASFDSGPCLKFPRQGQFHPLKYLRAIAERIIARGGRIHTFSPVQEIVDGEPAHVTTAGGVTVTARSVVVATNSPVNDWVKMHTKQAPYRTYVVGGMIPKDSVPQMLLWDTLDPYHYVRTQPYDAENDLLIIGGEDHKTGQDVYVEEDAAERWARLEIWSIERFPMIRDFPFQWSGQVMETIDGLGFLGKNPGNEHVYIITGDSGMGMTHCTIGAMICTDLIIGRGNRWAAVFNPDRKPLKAGLEFVKENINVAARYGEYITIAEVSADELRPGEGAIIRQGAGKVAAYKDEEGTVHLLSAVCPHLKCIVHWNGAERTWDCPCHGSRFDATGRVINGPALAGLEPAAAEKVAHDRPKS